MKEYTLAQASKELGLSDPCILRGYVQKGIVQGYKKGRNWYITEKELKKRQEVSRKWHERVIARYNKTYEN